MRSIFNTALEVETFLNAQCWKFCFIGGLALQRWGRQRLTRDVDLTILTGFGGEEKYIETLLKNFKSRRPDAFEFALKSRVLLLEDTNGIGIDISLGALFFEESAISRASQFQFLPQCTLTTCSAEDLVIMKSFANRLQDWADIEGIAELHGNTLNLRYIDQYLAPLLELKEEPEILFKLHSLLSSKSC